MKAGLEDGIEEYARQSVVCPRCRKVHYSHAAIMDQYIDCSCGHSFYAFACNGLRITMPVNEAGQESIARAMRKFVISTGRCTDIPPELYTDEDGQLCFSLCDLNAGIEEQLEIILERYQNELFGESYLTKEMLYSICEQFKSGNDVELRKKKNDVEVIRLIKKKLSSPEKKHRIGGENSKRGSVPIMIAGNGIMTHL